MLKTKELILENILDDYQNYINPNRILKKNYLTEEQKANRLQEILVPFSTFIYNKKKWGFPKLFDEKEYHLKQIDR
jgi:methyltransferase-like protein